VAVAIVSALASLASLVVEGVKDHFKGKQEIKKAVVENKVRLAQSSLEYNQAWEMKQLEQVGFKDDILFYAWLAFFVWSGFFPEDAARVIKAWEILPDWFLQITFWLVAAVLGVKKIGDNLPGLVRGVRSALKDEPPAAARNEEGEDA
jgi:hypothetical protein